MFPFDDVIMTSSIIVLRDRHDCQVLRFEHAHKNTSHSRLYGVRERINVQIPGMDVANKIVLLLTKTLS